MKLTYAQKIADTANCLEKTGANEDAVITLVAEATGMCRDTVRDVLNAFINLPGRFFFGE